MKTVLSLSASLALNCIKPASQPIAGACFERGSCDVECFSISSSESTGRNIFHRHVDYAIDLSIGLDHRLRRLLRNSKGQDLIEYALMAGFVAVAAGSIMPGVSRSISTIFSKIASVMTNASTQGS